MVNWKQTKGQAGYYVGRLGTIFIRISEDAEPNKLERFYEESEKEVLGKAVTDTRVWPDQFRYLIHECMRYEKLLETLERK